MTEDTEKTTNMAEQADPEKGHHHHHHDHPHHHGPHGPKGPKGGRPEFPKDSMMYLVSQLGHKVHHSDLSEIQDDKLFAVLTPEETTELKTLLTKVVDSWKKPEEAADKTADTTAENK